MELTLQHETSPAGNEWPAPPLGNPNKIISKGEERRQASHRPGTQGWQKEAQRPADPTNPH